jgi:HlyD family secretion protein
MSGKAFWGNLAWESTVAFDRTIAWKRTIASIATVAKVISVVLVLTGCQQQAPGNRFTGYIEAENIYIAAPASGWLVKLAVREGDVLQTDQLLFALDPTGAQADVAMAEAQLAFSEAEYRNLTTGLRDEEIAVLKTQLDEARVNLSLAGKERDRWTKLYQQSLASKERSDQAIADYQAALARKQTIDANIRVAQLGGRDAALNAALARRQGDQAALQKAQWQLNERSVRAKVAGRIEAIFQRQGEFVSAGAPVLSMQPPGGIKVRFFIPQARLAEVNPGKVIKVFHDGASQAINARITFIASEAEFTPPVIYSNESREKLVFLIEARPEKTAALHPGQPVTVSIP